MNKLIAVLRRLALAPLASICTEAAIAQDNIAGVERTFLERAAISTADQRCNLFTHGERMALASGLAQSRNELLRADYEAALLDEKIAELSLHTRTLGCDHSSITEVAAIIRDSYRHFVKINFMEFQTTRSMWEASRSEHDAWAIRQVDKPSSTILGMRRVEVTDPSISQEDAIALAVSVPATGRAPASAKLIIRDAEKLATPWLGSLIGPTAKLNPPPRSVTLPLWASIQAEEQDITKDDLHVFYFSATAIDRLNALDPREAILLELGAPPRAGSTKPKQIIFEVGDFTPALNFAKIPKPEYPPAGNQVATNDH